MARDVGRSLRRIPGTRALNYVALGGEEGPWITRLDPETGETRRITPPLEGSVNHAWTPGGTLLLGQGSTLHRWESTGQGRWLPVADLSGRGLRSITRLAVSPDGQRIAILAKTR